jgi:hypothetical protein
LSRKFSTNDSDRDSTQVAGELNVPSQKIVTPFPPLTEPLKGGAKDKRHVNSQINFYF